jgi:hypothetical protein
MAKRFAGFTDDQSMILLNKVGFTGQSMQSDEVNAFLASNPAAQAKLGKYAAAAQKRLDMLTTPTTGYAEGGAVDNAALNAAQQRLADAQNALSAAQQELAQIDPTKTEEVAAARKKVEAQQAKVTQAQMAVDSAQAAFSQTQIPSTSEATAAAINDPMSMTTTADVESLTSSPDQTIDPTTGQLTGPTPSATVTTADATTPVTAPDAIDAATITADTSESAVKDVLSKVETATGTVGPDALAKAATMTPEELSSLGLTVEQIKEAQTVKAPDARTIQEGELIDGSSVDMAAVDKAVNFEAATGAPSSAGTVQGQLTNLMEDFEGDATPAWAAGAMRAATAALASRGLGASSMAGQAIIQATMESALPIAMQDAQTNAGFEMQNLSNRQATAMFGAQQRAQFLGMDFDQKFQAKVANASRIADVANMNFTAEQQIALENARMAQTVDITNLNAKNAKIMADAASLSQMDMANLNNRQQASVQNAQAFLQMDMTNLNNEQQTTMMKAQSMVSTLLSDTAAQNAAKQFNASSENQTNQFYASLTSNIAQFNVDQTNAMSRFNAGEANTIEQFNSTLENQRDQFNSQNSLIVEQANTQWFQTIATTNNAAINQANRDATMVANNLTTTAYNNLLQKERDLISYAVSTANSNADRNTQLVIAKLQSEDAKNAANATKSAGWSSALGSLFAAVIK